MAKGEAKALDDRKEEVRSLATELKALEKALSAGFPVDAAAAGDEAGRDAGVVKESNQASGSRTGPDDFQREQLKHWYWTNLASRAGFDADAFKRQWWALGCVCLDVKDKNGRVDDAGR